MKPQLWFRIGTTFIRTRGASAIDAVIALPCWWKSINQGLPDGNGAPSNSFYIIIIKEEEKALLT